MKLVPGFAALLALMVTSGCVSQVVKTYDDPSLTMDKVAVLKGDATPPNFVHFTSYADLKAPGDLQFKSVGNSFIGYPGEVHILPGKYLVMTHCSSGRGYGFPSVPLEVKAGLTYEIDCESIESTQKVRAFVSHVTATP